MTLFAFDWDMVFRNEGAFYIDYYWEKLYIHSHPSLCTYNLLTSNIHPFRKDLQIQNFLHGHTSLSYSCKLNFKFLYIVDSHILVIHYSLKSAWEIEINSGLYIGHCM